MTQRNATHFATTTDTYWGQYDEISKYNIHLNVIEKLWAAWYAYMQNDVLATGIMSFLMHEIVYFGRSLPWMIIDSIPYFRKYKIQNVRRCLIVVGLRGLMYHSKNYQPPRSNGSVRNWFCSVTLPLSYHRYGMGCGYL